MTRKQEVDLMSDIEPLIDRALVKARELHVSIIAFKLNTRHDASGAVIAKRKTDFQPYCVWYFNDFSEEFYQGGYYETETEAFGDFIER